MYVYRIGTDQRGGEVPVVVSASYHVTGLVTSHHHLSFSLHVYTIPKKKPGVFWSVTCVCKLVLIMIGLDAYERERYIYLER